MSTKARLVTAQHAFFEHLPQGEALFSVRPDMPLADALKLASDFLAAARSSVYASAEGSAGDSAYGAGVLIDMAKAIVDSADVAISKGGAAAVPEQPKKSEVTA